MLDEEQQLIAKLRKIEALFARPGTEGERRAAEHASHRIRARLTALEEREPAVEFRFSLADAWSRSLFIAVLRRHGLRPYRYPGQRRTTVMVRVAEPVPKAFVALSVTVEVPAVVGMPVMTPVTATMLRPAGSPVAL